MTPEEFERLYRTSRSRALSFATRLTKGDRDLAEDLVQIAATKVWEAIERSAVTIEADGHFLALVHQHVRWGFLQHHQLLRTRNEVLGILDDWAATPDLIDNSTPAAAAEDITLARDIDPSTTRAFLKLSQRKRELLWLHHAVGLTLDELVPLFDMSRGYVSNTCTEARAEVRHNVEHPDELFKTNFGSGVPHSIAHRKHGTNKKRKANILECANGHWWADQEPCYHPTTGYRICRVCKLESQRRGRARARMNPPPPGVIRVGETCNKGHPWTKETLYVDPTGQRSCRICARERTARYRARKRELARTLVSA